MPGAGGLAGWSPTGRGVLALPSGRLVRGRALPRRPRGAGPGPDPTFALVLLGRRPEPLPWPVRWVRWPDFGRPADPADAAAALAEAWRRAATERVEVVCGSGRGRTGTALAGLAVLEGLAPRDAVRLVRRRYRRGAVETPGQARWLRELAAASRRSPGERPGGGGGAEECRP